MPVYAPAEVLPQLQARFPYLSRGSYAQLCPFYELEAASRTFAGFAIRAYRVPHGYNGWAYGFRAEAECSWAYIPDSIGIPELGPWRALDTLILGTSFYHERADYQTRSIYDVQEALQLIADIKPGRTVFTHLGHGIDRRKPAPAGTRYAFDGLVIDL
jgi:phosphoribosyl 1,2-cyclic phosphate phosphodiesterase